jgi:hypothetical protein
MSVLPDPIRARFEQGNVFSNDKRWRDAIACYRGGLDCIGVNSLLQDLELDDTEITDKGLDRLRLHRNLRTLSLKETNTTDVRRSIFEDQAPWCRITGSSRKKH